MALKKRKKYENVETAKLYFLSSGVVGLNPTPLLGFLANRSENSKGSLQYGKVKPLNTQEY